jgi:hypothetical protein
MGDDLKFGGTSTFMAFGIRGSGKSTLLEHIGENFMEKGSPIVDLFGSRDGEALAWLRSPGIEAKKVLLLHGDNTDVASSYDSKPVSRYTVADLDHYDLIISSSPLYSSIDEEFRQVNKITDQIYARMVWTKPAYVIVREAANLIYSRLKVSPDQTIAKGEMTYLIREARHCGFSMALDSQKLSSIDIDVRITIDYLFFKSLGIQGLPDDYRWLYKVYNPLKLQKMNEKYFLILTKTGSHGIGTFPYHDWHKKPGEDILKAVGVEVHHGEEMIQSKPDSKIGDLQHAEIIKMRNAGLSYRIIAINQGGISSATPYAHTTAHNKEIKRIGECSKCRRAKCELATTLIRDTIDGDPVTPTGTQNNVQNLFV